MSSLFSQQQAIEQSLNWQALQPDLAIQEFSFRTSGFLGITTECHTGYRFIFMPSNAFLIDDESR